MPPPPTDPKQPKCSRCRHHGIIIPKKGHTKLCPFLRCECCKCFLISQRTRVSNLQRNLQRSLQRARNAENPKPRPGAGGVKPAGEGAPGARASSVRGSGGGADPSATSGHVCPQRASGGTPECAAPTARSPVDLRSCRPEPGEPAAGLDHRDVLPRASSEPGQAVPLPLHFPFSLPGHYPGSYPLPPPVLLHLPSFPAVPPGLYDGLGGSLMFQPFQPFPTTLDPADCRPVFFTYQPLPPPDSFPGGADVEAAPSNTEGREV